MTDRFKITLVSLTLLCIFTVPFLSACEPKEQVSEEALTAEVLEGGIAILGVTQEPDFLDPHKAVSAGTKEILFNVYEGLFKLDSEGKFEPSLADSFEISEDGLSIDIKIRDDVYFHNGDKMQLADVLYSIRRAAGEADIKAIKKSLVDCQITEIDELSFRLTTAELDPDIIASLSLPIIQDSDLDLSKEANGTGPFKLIRYKPQTEIYLERFADYYGAKAHFDGVKILILADRDAASIDLQAGQIDIFPYLGSEKIAELEDNYQIYDGSANMVQLLAFNNQDEILQDPKLRAALNQAIDRQQIIDLVMNGHGKALLSGLSPAMSEYFNDKLEQFYKHDPDAAKSYIEENYPDLKLNCKVPANYLIHLDTAEVLKSQLAKVGVELEIERIDWLTWLEKVYSAREYQTTVIALTYDEFTARCVLERFATGASRNFINFHAEEYDNLVANILNNPKADERIRDYKRLQEILIEENASVFLQDPAALTAVHKSISGYIQYPAYIQDLAKPYFNNQEALEASLVHGE